MNRETASGIMLMLLMFAMLTLAFNVKMVKASGTIYIRADGSIDPPTAPIQRNGDVYTFTDNVNDSIVIERGNIVIDGAGYTLQGAGDGYGFDSYGVNNVTIQNTNISDWWCGIDLFSSSFNTISRNNIKNNCFGVMVQFLSNNNTVSGNNIENNTWDGVEIYASSFNTISGNNVKNNFPGDGLGLFSSSFNTVSENTIIDHNRNGLGLYWYSNNNTISENVMKNNGDCGLRLANSSYNRIYHNNLIDNTQQVNIYMSGYCANFWDDGYPSGGNYWSDHVCTGNPSNGTQPYVIDADNIDHYPFQDPNGWLHELTVTSSPITGVTFTINGIPEITSYTEWLPEGSYTLGMPETHNGYVWSHWLEDGDTNRIKTITLPGTIWTGVFVPASPPPTVGGHMVLIDKIELAPSPWTSTLIAFASVIIFATAISVVYVKHRKKQQL